MPLFQQSGFFISSDSVSSEQIVTASGGIALTSAIMYVESDGGDVIVTANPQIQAPPTGKDDFMILVIGKSDTNRVILNDGNGLSMSTSITLGLNAVVGYIWNATQQKYIMLFSDTK